LVGGDSSISYQQYTLVGGDSSIFYQQKSMVGGDSLIFYQQYTFVGGDPVKNPLTVCPCVPCLLPQQVKLQEQTAGHTGIVYQGVTSRLVQVSLQF
jgi:hypothetical protein